MRNSSGKPWRPYVRSTFLCLTLLVSLAACETSTDALIGIPGGGGLTSAQATGNWSFTVQRTSALACTSGSLANGQVLTARLDVLSDGTLASTSSWQNPPTTLVRPLTGSVALASGSTDLFMFASAGSTAAMELQGTMTAAGSFSGTLSDPAAGSFQVFGACSYTVAGTRTG
jgi:hypothetical protein